MVLNVDCWSDPPLFCVVSDGIAGYFFLRVGTGPGAVLPGLGCMSSGATIFPMPSQLWHQSPLLPQVGHVTIT
jgi:hypothetical protein